MTPAADGQAAVAARRRTWPAAGQPGRRMKGRRERGAARSWPPPGKESGIRRSAGGGAVRMRVQVMCVRGIPHGFERPGRGLTSPFGGFSLNPEEPPRRVQAPPESGRFHWFGCPRGLHQKAHGCCRRSFRWLTVVRYEGGRPGHQVVNGAGSAWRRWDSCGRVLRTRECAGLFARWRPAWHRRRGARHRNLPARTSGVTGPRAESAALPRQWPTRPKSSAAMRLPAHVPDERCGMPRAGTADGWPCPLLAAGQPVAQAALRMTAATSAG